MVELGLPASTVSAIIDDPTQIGSPTGMFALGISSDTAAQILVGYTRGFRTVFLLNASLAAFATVVSIVMIKQKELSRGDEAKLKQEAERDLKREELDTEMGEVKTAVVKDS